MQEAVLFCGNTQEVCLIFLSNLGTIKHGQDGRAGGMAWIGRS